MARPRFALILLLLLACFQHHALAVMRKSSNNNNMPSHHIGTKKTYVVYLGGHSHGPQITSADLHRATDSHHDLLASILGSKEGAKEAIIYSYRKYINGFAATLEEEDAQKLSEHPDVVSVFLSKPKKLQTTHTWSWLNLETVNGAVSNSSLWAKANYGSDVIIANIDTGVWPESESFSDEGFGPVPSRWKGSCENSSEVACNRKLIGAKYFNKAYLEYIHGNMSTKLNNAMDHEGHGSHTLSTAGGNIVKNAKVIGTSIGTAKGGAPSARVAAYKACWPQVSDGACWDADIIAAFDEAIHDGVDVISVSLGGEAGPYFQDGISIGSFHAMQRNIPVIAAAGNDGPAPGTVTNVAPWLVTVAAATHDRQMQSTVELPNNILLKGAGLSPPLARKNSMYPVVLSGHARNDNSSYEEAELCFAGTLDEEKVKGKIVVCLRGSTGRIVKGIVAAQAGAAGMILCNDASSGDEISPDLHFLPAAHISYKDSLTLYAYLNSTSRPTAYIQPTRQVFHITPAPEVIGFSSRGPNTVTPQILKPDISAPGVDIVAAWSPLASPLDNSSIDSRVTAYNVISGTSMATPHVSGVVALLKSIHPDWSPAAIKSAIMTTARIRDNTMHPIQDNVDHNRTTPLAFGAGHVQPTRAMNPGLVYDMAPLDHFNFLCAIGYNQTMIDLVSGHPHHQCPQKNFNLHDYNYPSISITDLVPAGNHVTIKRTLKNVGPPATYKARLGHPSGVILTVQPDTLSFSKLGEEKSFTVTVKPKQDGGYSGTNGFGDLVWSSDHGNHVVRSPVAASFAPK